MAREFSVSWQAGIVLDVKTCYVGRNGEISLPADNVGALAPIVKKVMLDYITLPDSRYVTSKALFKSERET